MIQISWWDRTFHKDKVVARLKNEITHSSDFSSACSAWEQYLGFLEDNKVELNLDRTVPDLSVRAYVVLETGADPFLDYAGRPINNYVSVEKVAAPVAEKVTKSLEELLEPIFREQLSWTGNSNYDLWKNSNIDTVKANLSFLTTLSAYTPAPKKAKTLVTDYINRLLTSLENVSAKHDRDYNAFERQEQQFREGQIYTINADAVVMSPIYHEHYVFLLGQLMTDAAQYLDPAVQTRFEAVTQKYKHDIKRARQHIDSAIELIETSNQKMLTKFGQLDDFYKQIIPQIREFYSTH